MTTDTIATPADAQATLDKLLSEARLEGWRAGRDAAAEIAAASGGVKSAPLNDGCGTVICQPVMGYAVAAHIRALPEPKEAQMGWNDPKEYDLSNDAVQVLCEVTQPKTSDFPRACEMPISSGDHGVGERFVSIGWRDDEGEWHVAGWDMVQDCWDDARCYIVHGWMPLSEPPKESSNV